MKFLKTPFISTSWLIALMILPAVTFCQSGQKEIEKAIRNGDAKTLSAHFSSSLELAFPGKEGSFSKTQATVLMDSFFTNYPPSSFKEVHHGTSAYSSSYHIGEYVSGNTTFRTYYLCKNQNDATHIFQLHFEKK